MTKCRCLTNSLIKCFIAWFIQPQSSSTSLASSSCSVISQAKTGIWSAAISALCPMPSGYSSRSLFWKNAQSLYGIMPHAFTVQCRHCTMPCTFTVENPRSSLCNNTPCLHRTMSCAFNVQFPMTSLYNVPCLHCIMPYAFTVQYTMPSLYNAPSLHCTMPHVFTV